MLEITSVYKISPSVVIKTKQIQFIIAGQCCKSIDYSKSKNVRFIHKCFKFKSKNKIPSLSVIGPKKLGKGEIIFSLFFTAVAI